MPPTYIDASPCTRRIGDPGSNQRGPGVPWMRSRVAGPLGPATRSKTRRCTCERAAATGVTLGVCPAGGDHNQTDSVDGMGSVSAEAYRHAMAHLCGGVCLVTCQANGLDHAMTATAVSAVSLTPPLLLVSVDRKSRFHAALEAADDLAVTFLADRQVDCARHFARSGRDLTTQFDGVATRRLSNGCLILRDGLSGVGAHIESRLPGGDHTLVLAELTEVAAGAAPASAGPLVHFRSGFHALPDAHPLA